MKVLVERAAEPEPAPLPQPAELADTSSSRTASCHSASSRRSTGGGSSASFASLMERESSSSSLSSPLLQCPSPLPSTPVTPLSVASALLEPAVEDSTCDSTNLIVNYVPVQLSEEALRSMFAEYGAVHR
jgi:hypothetical protein